MRKALALAFGFILTSGVLLALADPSELDDITKVLNNTFHLDLNTIYIPPQLGNVDMSVPINAALASGAYVKLLCGDYPINNSILMPSNSELSGPACAHVIALSSISANTQWANVNANPTFATAIANLDMLNGNSNIDIHGITVDISEQITAIRFIWGIGFGTASNYNVYNTSIIGKGDNHGNGQDGIASLNSHDGHIYNNYIYGTGNGSIDLFQSSHDIKIDHNTVDTNGTGFGVTANGSGKDSSGTIIPTPVYNIIIDHNTLRNTVNGLLLTGLCTNTTGVCGTNYGFIVDSNIIDNVTQFHGIDFGDSSNFIITNNKISNTKEACILGQSSIAGGGGFTSGTIISNNHCSNINLSGNTTISAISIGNGSDIPTNTIITDNEVLGATPKASAVTFPFAIATNGTVVGNTLTGTFVGVIKPNVGQVLTGVGITGSPTITAANGSPPTSWTISGGSQGTVGPETMSASGQAVTSYSINSQGYCTTVPTVVFTGSGTGASATATLSNGSSGNLVGLTPGSAGSGYLTPPTISFTGCNPPQYIYATRVFPGSVNTSFSPGPEDAGSTGADLIQGSIVPVTVYGAHTFSSNALFTDFSLGITITNSNTSGYSQERFAPTGSTHNYQIGEAGTTETNFGIPNCFFLLDSNPGRIDIRVCPSGDIEINPIKGTPGVQILDVNGFIRSAPGVFIAAGTCNAAHEGSFGTITDSTTTTIGATITGSGGNIVLGWCNGTVWKVVMS